MSDTKTWIGRNGGTMAPTFAPGQSGNPGGMPKDFVPLSRAYATVSTLDPAVIKTMAEEMRYPPKWSYPQCFTYIAAARAWIELQSKPVPGLLSELADRTEGKVVQKVQNDLTLHGVLVVPASAIASSDWSKDVIDAETIERKALTGQNDET